ncbi:MAG TPA: methyl-accepting chemotaxis protein [Candidatus Obscuribacterales bacterium]
MFKGMTLQGRLIGSFLFMGSIVFAATIMGWNSTSRLSTRIDTISKNSIPSISGLWKINEGQTQAQSSMRSLTNPRLSKQDREVELNRIQDAWQQINEGFEEYQSAPQSPDEAKLYKAQFLPNWEAWKQEQARFLRLYQELEPDGISLPELDRLRGLLATEERLAFNTSTNDMLALLDLNYKVAKEAEKLALSDVKHTSALAILGMVLGPTIAIGFGFYFSRAIAKPLSTKLGNVINTLASSSTEIAVAVEQQERTAAQQAVSVSQTTATMDELGTSARQSASQAESAVTGAQQVLMLVNGSSSDELSAGGTSLKEKVGQIARQISRLSEQTNQIGNISDLVRDLANQTNMLALNAAVEAARAGDQGKGFAVVATEIRKLADQSRQSTERINALLTDIQNTTNVTVMVTDEGTKTVETIVVAVNGITMNSQQISLTAKQQAIAIQQVIDAMNVLNQGASQTASSISQTKVETQKLNETALNLKALV